MDLIKSCENECRMGRNGKEWEGKRKDCGWEREVERGSSSEAVGGRWMFWKDEMRTLNGFMFELSAE